MKNKGRKVIWEKFQKANWSNGTCSNDDSAEYGNGCGNWNITNREYSSDAGSYSEDSQEEATVVEDVSAAEQETVTEQETVSEQDSVIVQETASEENVVEETAIEVVTEETDELTAEAVEEGKI